MSSVDKDQKLKTHLTQTVSHGHLFLRELPDLLHQLLRGHDNSPLVKLRYPEQPTGVLQIR